MENFELYDSEYYETDCGHTNYNKVVKYFPEKIKTILDLGCGDGKGLISLIGKAEKLIGVDFSSVAIDLAKRQKEKIGKNEIYFYHSDIVKNLKNYGKFDIILMIDVVEHIEKERMKLVAKELDNHLTENGLVIVYTPIYEKKRIVKIISRAKEKKDTNRHEFYVYYMHINLQTNESVKELFKDYNIQFPEQNIVLVRKR